MRGRPLNRLYVELLKGNPEWGTAERRHDMNHLMARLIVCFFAERTGIFIGGSLFTATIEQMSARDSSNTHEMISTLFRAMNMKIADRATAGGSTSTASSRRRRRQAMAALYDRRDSTTVRSFWDQWLTMVTTRRRIGSEQMDRIVWRLGDLVSNELLILVE
jgi:hypothetical protein